MAAPQIDLTRIDPEEFPEYWRPLFEEHRELIESILLRICPDRVTWNRYPARSNVFRAFLECLVPIIVVIGQDPYPGGHGHGLCFSVLDQDQNNRAVPFPASLANIFTEMTREGLPVPMRRATRIVGGIPQEVEIPSGNLAHLAQQGFLLLNASLTVSPGKAGSDMVLWEPFTRRVLEYVARTDGPEDPGCCFVLWGNFAQGLRYHKVKGKRVDLIGEASGHLVLTSGHPSPLSVARFAGNGHFLEIARFMRDRYGREVKWNALTE